MHACALRFRASRAQCFVGWATVLDRSQCRMTSTSFRVLQQASVPTSEPTEGFAREPGSQHEGTPRWLRLWVGRVPSEHIVAEVPRLDVPEDEFLGPCGPLRTLNFIHIQFHLPRSKHRRLGPGEITPQWYRLRHVLEPLRQTAVDLIGLPQELCAPTNGRSLLLLCDLSRAHLRRNM